MTCHAGNEHLAYLYSVPHASFDDKRYHRLDPRESIELRILVVY